MKIKFYTFILVSIIWSFNSNLFSQNSAFNINQKLGRGVNLGNVFEGSFEGEWGITLNEKYFEIINEAGFNSVRIPIRWSSHADSLAPYAIDSVFMARIKWAINTALKNNLMAIINIHHYYDLFEKPEENKPRLLGIWNQISKEFKDYSDSLLFELCNEPNTNLTPSLWNAYAKEILDTVRVLNPKRTCIIGTAEWGGIGALPLLKLPGDTSIILTIHYYNPFQFTHQGADWVDGADAWLGSTWDSTISQQNAIINDLEKIKQYSDTANVPVFIGEFGSYSKADMDSRARWTAFCARKFEEYGFSWSYWEFASGFGFFDPGALVWRVELVKALTEMYPDSYLPLTGDTILLSDFSFGANWSLGLQGGALANIDNENEMYHITITNGGTANWHIQMIQNQIPIIYKTTYKVSFDAYSPDNLTINPYIGRNGDPWDSYSGANSISLTPSLQNYSFTFTKQEMTDLTARMAIDMGNQTGEVYFDNIIIEKIAKTNPVTSIIISTETGDTVINEPEDNLQVIIDIEPNECTINDLILTVSGNELIYNFSQSTLLLSSTGQGNGKISLKAESRFDSKIYDIQEFVIESASTGYLTNSKSAGFVLVYPTYTYNFVYLEFDQLPQMANQLNIYDIVGNLVISEKLVNKKNEADLSAYPEGIYIIKIETQNQILTRKIIKRNKN